MAGNIETVVKAQRSAAHPIIPFRITRTHAPFVFTIRQILNKTFEQAQTATTRSHNDAPSSLSLRMAIERDNPELKKQQPKAKEETE